MGTHESQTRSLDAAFHLRKQALLSRSNPLAPLTPLPLVMHASTAASTTSDGVMLAGHEPASR